MKKIYIYRFFIGVIMLAVICLGISIFSEFASQESKANSKSEYESEEYKAISILGLRNGELKVVEEQQNIQGDIIQKLSDDSYSYFYDTSKDAVIVLSACDQVMNKIVKEAPDNFMSSLSETEIDINKYIHQFFPEYNLNTIKISLDTSSGSPLESFRYTISDYQDGTKVNNAQMSFSYDGQLTFLYGTHNNHNNFKTYGNISEKDAISIAFSYLSNLKKDIENDANKNYTDDVPETIIATDDMILPDGVKPGETFISQKLPRYVIYLDTESDMSILSTEKTIYGNRVAWLIEFIVKTSWGDIDTIFNPLIHVYVDIENGNVLEMNSTNGY